MTILATDIKLVESERMTDTPDGGGRRTTNVIPDGEPGNIFSKVSRLDSVYGKVNLRKIFAHVDTENLDTYAGTHAAILDAADAEKIVVSLFSTGSDFDTRARARDFIESYVVSGPLSRMYLWGRQLVGQQALSCLQRVEEVLPEVGDVFCLSKEVAGVVQHQQFVRVEGVAQEIRNFTDDVGDYSRRMITLSISTPLRYEFVGIEIPHRNSSIERSGLTSFVRSTNVANAASYYGIKPVTGEVLTGALELSVASVYASIVPTTQREVAISNAQIGGAGSHQAAAHTALAARAIGAAISGPGGIGGAIRTVEATLGMGVAPGSLSIYVKEAGGANQSPPATDAGDGTINAGAALAGYDYQITGGSVDYGSGTVSVNVKFGNGLWSGQVYASFIPAVDISQPAHSSRQEVTLATRGTVQVRTLRPLPAKGTVSLDFRALGKWYRLRDQGDGTLAGDDPAYGAGTIDYNSGALVATLGALPDIGSSIITAWGSPEHFAIRATTTSDAEASVSQRFHLSALPIKPGTLEIQYVAGATTYTATADAAGVIAGGGLAGGSVDHATGAVELRYATRLPNTESVITCDYTQEVPTGADPTSVGTSHTFVSWADPTYALGEPIEESGLEVTIPVILPGAGGGGSGAILLRAHDDGDGELVTLPGTWVVSDQAWQHAGGTVVGSVVYATGVVTLDPEQDIVFNRPSYQRWLSVNGGVNGGWITVDYPFHMAFGEYGFTGRTSNASSDDAQNEEFDQEEAPLTFNLTATVSSQVVPGSVVFTATGKVFFERNGVLYHTMAADGSGTAAGSFDYDKGEAMLANYGTNVALAPTVHACLTKYGNFTVQEVAFRTAGSPVRSASTVIIVTAEDGEELIATTDTEGLIVGDQARGEVNQQMGVVFIQWGEMVTAAGNEEEPWYDEDDVVGGMIWKPRGVMPSTIRYSTVVLSNLPLNADVIGLDPVRLPSDGRVPIFRPGDVALLHNTKWTELTNPVAAGATYSAGRADLADLVLFDDGDTRVPADQYVVNLAAGTVTMAADMDLGALVEPLKARHRIESLHMLTDVQINGQLTLASPVARDFDDDTLVSGCLLFGDLYAQTSNVFDQATWTGAWADAVTGSGATGEYNLINYPITVRNDGAVTERWRISFTGSTTFQVIGENLGVITTGSTSANCSPVNPLTGEPYFLLESAGWGLGWATGNQLRFNTKGATASIWLARTVLPGAPLTGDSIDLQVRGDVDA